MSQSGTVGNCGLEESDSEGEEEMMSSQESISSQKSLVREISRAALSSPPKKSRGNDDTQVGRIPVKQPQFDTHPSEFKGKRRLNCLNPAKVQSTSVDDPFAAAFPPAPLMSSLGSLLPTSHTEVEEEMPEMKKTQSDGAVETRRIFTEPKKRAAYRHVWSSNVDESSESADTQKSSSLPKVAANRQAGGQISTRVTPAKAVEGKLTRTVKQSTDPFGDCHTSLRCDRASKEQFMVVKNVLNPHQCHESGEVQEFADDMDYIMSSLESYANDSSRDGVKLMCTSVQKLGEKCLVQQFRNFIRARSICPKIFSCILKGWLSSKSPELAFCGATVIYILSRDRLGFRVDRSTLRVIVDFMKLDNQQITTKLNASADLRRRKEDLGKILDHWKSLNPSSTDTFVSALTADNMSPCLLATESLAWIASHPQEKWFPEELSKMGALDVIVQMVANRKNHLIESTGGSVGVDLWMLQRLLKIVEQGTFNCPLNQMYLIPLDEFSLLGSCVQILSFCHRVMITEPNGSEQINAAYFECLTAALKVLCNLTHDNELGCAKLGQQEEFFSSCLSCIVSRPQLTESQKFDILVLGLGLMINSVEHCSANRRYILTAKLSYKDDSAQDGREMSAVEALTRLFLRHEAIARELDEDTDEHTEAESTESPANHTEDLQDTVKNALQKAGKHMENSIAASYAALLIGCVIQFDDEEADFVKSLMPSKSLKPMIEMVSKILEFMEMTSFAGNTGNKAMAKILEALENLD